MQVLINAFKGPISVTPTYPNDLTSSLPLEPTTPARMESPAVAAMGNTRRRQTLMTLLDALNELSKDDALTEHGE